MAYIHVLIKKKKTGLDTQDSSKQDYVHTHLIFLEGTQWMGAS